MENLSKFNLVMLSKEEYITILGGHKGFSYNVGLAVGKTLGLFSNMMDKVLELSDFL